MEDNNQNQTIEYVKAKYSSRLFAFAVDLMTMIITSLLLVVLAQFITINTDGYKNILSTLDDIQEKSHLYEYDHSNKEWLNKAKYYNDPETDDDYKTYNKKLDEALTQFYTDPYFFDQTDEKSGIYLYDIQKIPEGLNHTELFIKDGDKIVESATADLKDLYKFYINAISKDAVTYLMKNDAYMNASRSVTLIFIFIELLIPIVTSVLIYEFAIPAFDRHGRRTLGKRIFKLGVVDVKALSPKFGRFTCRFLLFLFAEILLSVVALLLPIIISFSMVLFSKTGQSFHDYVTNTYVVDISQSFICNTKKEYDEKHNLEEKFSPTSKDLILK